MDGETALLEDGDFPAVIELTEPVIPVIREVGNRDREPGNDDRKRSALG